MSPQISGRPEEALDLPKLHIKILSTSSCTYFIDATFGSMGVRLAASAWSGLAALFLARVGQTDMDVAL